MNRDTGPLNSSKSDRPGHEGGGRIVVVAVGSRFKPLACRIDLPVTVGRAEGRTLRISDPLISRDHCRIFQRDGKLWIKDLDSLNGTFVGNRRVNQELLPYGEIVTVGPLSLRVEPGDAEPPGVVWCTLDEFTDQLKESSVFGESPLTSESGDTPRLSDSQSDE